MAAGHLVSGVSSQLGARSPNCVGRYDGRGVDHRSPAELSRATRLSRPARRVSDQRHFVVLLYTLSRDTTSKGTSLKIGSLDVKELAARQSRSTGRPLRRKRSLPDFSDRLSGSVRRTAALFSATVSGRRRCLCVDAIRFLSRYIYAIFQSNRVTPGHVTAERARRLARSLREARGGH